MRPLVVREDVDFPKVGNGCAKYQERADSPLLAGFLATKGEGLDPGFVANRDNA